MQQETKSRLLTQATVVVALVLVVLAPSLAMWWGQSHPRRVEVPVPGPTATQVVEVPLPAPTVTVTAKPKPRPTKTVYIETSRSKTRSDPTLGLSASQRAVLNFDVWLSSPTARLVISRESHGICTVVSSSGKYQGKWQMDDNFWKAYGGLAYAPNPHQASCHEQDLVAHSGWVKRGWQPWPTA